MTGTQSVADNRYRSKYERGRDILVEISGIPADAPKADYAILAPEIEVFLKEHLFADLFERDVLTYAERELTTVAVIASLGKGVEPMLKGHMGIALNVGITPDELRSVLAIVEKNIGRGEADGGRLALNEVLQSKGFDHCSGSAGRDNRKWCEETESNVPQPFSDRYGR